jgi:hypothetical protein
VVAVALADLERWSATSRPEAELEWRTPPRVAAPAARLPFTPAGGDRRAGRPASGERRGGVGIPDAGEVARRRRKLALGVAAAVAGAVAGGVAGTWPSAALGGRAARLRQAVPRLERSEGAKGDASTGPRGGTTPTSPRARFRAGRPPGRARARGLRPGGYSDRHPGPTGASLRHVGRCTCTPARPPRAWRSRSPGRSRPSSSPTPTGPSDLAAARGPRAPLRAAARRRDRAHETARRVEEVAPRVRPP